MEEARTNNSENVSDLKSYGDIEFMPNVDLCKYWKNGCQYENENFHLLDRHERWLCKYDNTICRQCGMKYPDTRRMDHEIQNHAVELTPIYIADEVSVTYNNVAFGNSNYFVKAFDTMFFLVFTFSSRVISMKFVLDNDDEKCLSGYYVYGYKISFSEKINTVSGEFDSKNGLVLRATGPNFKFKKETTCNFRLTIKRS